ncbi:MAG: hypothetical protein JWO25_763 [Alphaproteobacteria bacterium]|nr:hypothetical protein [Alphaproteobacteria bacterium]
MRLSSLFLLWAVPSSLAAAPPPAKPPARCAADRPIYAGEGQDSRVRRLGELPPAKLYLSVDREVAGCREPVIVRYGIGATAGPEPRRN